MRHHAERTEDHNLRSYSVPPRNRRNAGPSIGETIVALVIGFGGVAYIGWNLYNLFIA